MLTPFVLLLGSSNRPSLLIFDFAFQPVKTMGKTHKDPATAAERKKPATAAVCKKPSSRSGTSQTVLLARMKTQGELDRDRITELESKLGDAEEKLADANKQIEHLRQQASSWAKEMLQQAANLERQLIMHNAGGLAVLSGEVPTSRGYRRG